jgi:WD40 repeat protein
VDDWSVQRRVDQAHDKIANACCVVGPGRFASVGRDRNLRLWDTQDSDSDGCYASPQPHSVKCLAVDDGLTTVLTGCYGGTLARFDLASRRWTDMQRPTDAGISAITWDRRQQRFLAASFDGGIFPVAA